MALQSIINRYSGRKDYNRCEGELMEIHIQREAINIIEATN